MRENMNKTIKFVSKNTVIQRFILIVCSNHAHKFTYEANGLMAKCVFMQHIFILSEYLSDNFVRYRFIQFKCFFML